jgi:hypothetical protein
MTNVSFVAEHKMYLQAERPCRSRKVSASLLWRMAGKVTAISLFRQEREPQLQGKGLSEMGICMRIDGDFSNRADDHSDCNF